MATADLTSFSSLLKRWYRAPIVSQINLMAKFYDRLKKDNKFIKAGGDFIVIPVQDGYNQSFGAVAMEGATIPTAGRGTYSSANFYLKQLLGRARIEWSLIEKTKTDREAFARGMDREVKGLAHQAARQLNFYLMGDGSARLTGVAASSTGTSLTVDSTKHLKANMIVDIRDEVTGTADVTGVTISSIDSATTLTLSAASPGALATDGVYLEGSRNNAPWGINMAIDNADNELGQGNFGAIARTGANNAFWDAQVLTNSGTNRELTLALLQRAFDDCRELGGGGEPSLLVSNFAVHRKYRNILLSDRTFNQPGGPRAFDGGASDYKYDGVDWMQETHAPDNVLFGVDCDSIFLQHTGPMDFMEQHGTMLFPIANTPAWDVIMKYYVQLCADKVNSSFRIEDITE